MKSYLPPIIAATILITAVLLTFTKCNKSPVSPDIQRIEQLDREKKELIDKYNNVLQGKVDTVYIERTRIRIKNDSIFIYQSEVANLNPDSAAKYLLEWTSKPAIHD